MILHHGRSDSVSQRRVCVKLVGGTSGDVHSIVILQVFCAGLVERFLGDGHDVVCSKMWEEEERERLELPTMNLALRSGIVERGGDLELRSPTMQSLPNSKSSARPGRLPKNSAFRRGTHQQRRSTGICTKGTEADSSFPSQRERRSCNGRYR